MNIEQGYRLLRSAYAHRFTSLPVSLEAEAVS